MEKFILELIFTLLCLPLIYAACYYRSAYGNYYCYYYNYYSYSYSSVGTYAGAAVGGIVFLIVVAVVVVCVCAAKNSQRNRVVTMQGGGATVTNVNNVNTIQHPRKNAMVLWCYGAPPPPGYGPGFGQGYSQPSQSMFNDPAYPPNQYPPPKY
ncbi:uncharacterized protein LOC128160438 [Crassostrea angulata]|uniref:uncharacterized protein LOC128160438 n=1 Tax=Magallana angulata TaxID=2784310 RepID=UPI0022B16A0D|nr:uncharacterized protein LOC128160438 [Crassostrea angulata]